MSTRAKPDPARKELRSLVAVVEQFLEVLDREMEKPSTVERGRRIAAACNALNLQKDIAKRFGLKIPFRPRSLATEERP